MEYSAPCPGTLFSLVPLNPRAKAVVAHPENSHLVSRTFDNDHSAIDIGRTRSGSGDPATLATLGRAGDVKMQGSIISKIQCSFEINLETNVVMFYDRSHSQTCQVFGSNATPFEYDRPRKVVVQHNLNTLIGLGGEGRNLIQFRLEWHFKPSEAMELIKRRSTTASVLEDNPGLARTIAEAVEDPDTVVPSRRETRPRTALLQPKRLRWAEIMKLGSGQFGVVSKAVDVDTGRLMTAKILKRPRDYNFVWHHRVAARISVSHLHVASSTKF